MELILLFKTRLYWNTDMNQSIDPLWNPPDRPIEPWIFHIPPVWLKVEAMAQRTQMCLIVLWFNVEPANGRCNRIWFRCNIFTFRQIKSPVILDGTFNRIQFDFLRFFIAQRIECNRASWHKTNLVSPRAFEQLQFYIYCSASNKFHCKYHTTVPIDSFAVLSLWGLLYSVPYKLRNTKPFDTIEDQRCVRFDVFFDAVRGIT